ncbi:MAG TPA: histidine phosphatase family protein [Anaeromyxobacter sp.]|nr:histidine phosphatase family protein [Anaeromyxobacter sp.]
MPHKRVFLVRHAKAEAHSQDDGSRRLTAKGRSRFSALVALLGDRLEVARVVTSPLVRARETAEILARAKGCPVREDPRLLAGRSSPEELLALARRAASGTALVGHNPEIAEALAEVTGEDLEVKPGAIAAIEVRGEDLSLVFIETPGKE